MDKHELLDLLTELNNKAGKNSKPIAFTDAEYEIFEKAYIALDLEKQIFAKFVFADARAFIDNESKWDFINNANNYYVAKLQYDSDLAKIDEFETELRRLKARRDNYEKTMKG